ncbi:DUF397 domain-containing protein [Streptomyces sp. NPDC005355]|uniref:DUF397 domain-containing protein n=1 Tax=Streptomyces sp. NPDC005355 TaxID=3157038 RepID=UPI0033B9AA1B
MNLTELPWRKSSYSMGNGGNCVEVAEAESFIHVRDSKNPDGPALRFDREQWQLLVKAVRNDR